MFKYFFKIKKYINSLFLNKLYLKKFYKKVRFRGLILKNIAYWSYLLPFQQITFKKITKAKRRIPFLKRIYFRFSFKISRVPLLNCYLKTLLRGKAFLKNKKKNNFFFLLQLIIFIQQHFNKKCLLVLKKITKKHYKFLQFGKTNMLKKLFLKNFGKSIQKIFVFFYKKHNFLNFFFYNNFNWLSFLFILQTYYYFIKVKLFNSNMFLNYQQNYFIGSKLPFQNSSIFLNQIQKFKQRNIKDGIFFSSLFQKLIKKFAKHGLQTHNKLVILLQLSLKNVLNPSLLLIFLFLIKQSFILLELLPMRQAGKKIYIPSLVMGLRQVFVTFHLIKKSILQRKELTFYNRVLNEILDLLLHNRSLTNEKIVKIYNLAIKNESNLHFRWKK